MHQEIALALFHGTSIRRGLSVLQSATTLARQMVRGAHDNKAQGWASCPRLDEIQMYNLDSDELDQCFSDTQNIVKRCEEHVAKSLNIADYNCPF